MGYNEKKNKETKPKKNKVVENIKSELNEWTDTTFKGMPKRWSGAMDKGLTPYETLIIAALVLAVGNSIVKVPAETDLVPPKETTHTARLVVKPDSAVVL